MVSCNSGIVVKINSDAGNGAAIRRVGCIGGKVGYGCGAVGNGRINDVYIG